MIQHSSSASSGVSGSKTIFRLLEDDAPVSIRGSAISIEFMASFSSSRLTIAPTGSADERGQSLSLAGQMRLRDALDAAFLTHSVRSTTP